LFLPFRVRNLVNLDYLNNFLSIDRFGRRFNCRCRRGALFKIACITVFGICRALTKLNRDAGVRDRSPETGCLFMIHDVTFLVNPTVPDNLWTAIRRRLLATSNLCPILSALASSDSVSRKYSFHIRACGRRTLLRHQRKGVPLCIGTSFRSNLHPTEPVVVVKRAWCCHVSSA